MKRSKSILVVLAIAVILIITSCSTTIAVKTLVPAKVDVSGYKTIAVRSTQDETRWILPVFWNSDFPIGYSIDGRYRGFLRVSSHLDFSVSSTITNTASKTIYKAINTGFFTVLEPGLTDSLVSVGQYSGNVRDELMNKNVDALLTTKISDLWYDESIISERDIFSSKDSNGKEYYRTYFYAVQKYSISISYTLTDVENNKIIASDTISSGMREHKTTLGWTKNADGDFESSSYSYIPYASSLFSDLIKEFSDSFRNALSPHYTTVYFDFMKNKPEVKSLDKAYDALDDENWDTALRLFADEYARSGHIPSGYNAAILYFATGRTETALAMANELYTKYGSEKGLDLYYYLKRLAASEDAANSQINSTEKSGSSPSNTDLVGL